MQCLRETVVHKHTEHSTLLSGKIIPANNPLPVPGRRLTSLVVLSAAAGFWMMAAFNFDF